MRALSAIDGDPEAAIAELEALVRALKEDRTHIQRIEHSESTEVENAATETVELSYILTEGFDGIDPIQYSNTEDA